MAGPSYIAHSTEIVPLGRAVPLQGNPHQGDVVAVARSLARFGQRKPIVLRRLEDGRGEIEAGNTTYRAACLLNDLAARLAKNPTSKRAQLKLRETLGSEAAAALQATVDEHGDGAWSGIAVTWVDEPAEVGLAFAATDNFTARLGQDDPQALAALTDRVAALEQGLVGLFTAAPDPLPQFDPDPAPPPSRDRPALRPERPQPPTGDPLEASAQRTLTFPVSLADFAWVQAHMGNLRRDWDLPDDSQVLLRLVGQQVGAHPPGLIDVAAAEDDDL